MLFTLYDDMIESITLLSLFVVLWVGAGQMGWEFFWTFQIFQYFVYFTCKLYRLCF